jgi:hypothetical protein
MLFDGLPCNDLGNRSLYLLPVIAEFTPERCVTGLVIAKDLECSDQFRRVGAFDTGLFSDRRPPTLFHTATNNVQRMYDQVYRMTQRRKFELV